MGDMHGVDWSKTRDLQQTQTLKEMRRANWIQIVVVLIMLIGYIIHNEAQNERLQQRFDDSDKAQEQVLHRLDNMQSGLDYLERHVRDEK